MIYNFNDFNKALLLQDTTQLYIHKNNCVCIEEIINIKEQLFHLPDSLL